MNKWFAEVKTVEELRERYRALLKKYHPDNENGSIEVTQEINEKYDRLFAILSKENKSDSQSYTYDNKAENEAFKAVINGIIHVNADVEIIGSWVWVHGGYEYRELLKSIGFRYAPKKKCWCWHYGEYYRPCVRNRSGSRWQTRQRRPQRKTLPGPAPAKGKEARDDR